MKIYLFNWQVLNLHNTCFAVQELRSRTFQNAAVRTLLSLSDPIKVLSKQKEILSEDEFEKVMWDKVEVDIYIYDGDLPNGSYIIKEPDPTVKNKMRDAEKSNRITLGQADGLLPILSIKTESLIKKEIEIDNNYIFNYHQMLSSLFSINIPDFVNLFKENLRILQEIAYQLSINPIVLQYRELEKKQAVLRTKWTLKDSEGNPVISTLTPGTITYQITDISSYKEELQIFNTQNQELIDKYVALMDTKIKLSLFSVPESMIWDDIDGTQLKALMMYM